MTSSPFEPWSLLRTAAGACARPQDLPDGAEWLPALVPGTLGASFQALGRWHPDDVIGFDGSDTWYRTAVQSEGDAILRFEGLATIAEIFLDGTLVGRSDNMFTALDIPVALAGRHDLAIAFRSLEAFVAGKKGRARWRPKLVQPPALRHARTLLLGHIPGWAPPVHAVGPYRPVSLLSAQAQRVADLRINATVDGTFGMLEIALRLTRPAAGWITARIGMVDFALVADADGVLRGEAEIPDVSLWWPHTHGTPHLYALTVYAGEETLALGAVGFRTITVDRDVDGKGFGLRVNGEPVFCRGACWTSPDMVALPFDRAAYEHLLTLARDGGMNMVRIGGTMGYEGDAFYALCDELGLLVWQDFAFSNFDYPAADPSFRASVEAEARQILHRTMASPCLAVLCGASEVAQQAAMLGMPQALWSNTIFDDLLPAVAADLRPDVTYVAHSPWGGDLPFVADEGISHYYGVSAHRRPVEEARRANVRFSAESLGFANVPDSDCFTLEPDGPEIVHPNFVERHPHDVAASWAFEGVRNHYTASLYGVDVTTLRRDDPERFLDMARATSAEVMEATYGEWRRHGSPTRGALVWFLRDMVPGAGWGVVDVRNQPKAAYFGLKRAFRPLRVIMTDENLNGLRLTLINETPEPRSVTLDLRCLRDGKTVVMRASTSLRLEARGSIALAASTLWGGFFDTTYAFRFGEPSHDATVATLIDEVGGAFLDEGVYFPLGRGHERHDLGLRCDLDVQGDEARLSIATDRLAQSVRIACEGWLPHDNWFHLSPDKSRRVVLRRQPGGSERPAGFVRALNGMSPAYF